MAPEPVKPVSENGIQYEAIHWGWKHDLDQNGGYIRATKDGEQLWLLKIYTTEYDKNLERDVQDVFITELKIVNPESLEVRDERDRVYWVNLKSRKVRRLP